LLAKISVDEKISCFEHDGALKNFVLFVYFVVSNLGLMQQ